jgi:hypothetical protein
MHGMLYYKKMCFPKPEIHVPPMNIDLEGYGTELDASSTITV